MEAIKKVLIHFITAWDKDAEDGTLHKKVFDLK
jgi:hypothetical protein